MRIAAIGATLLLALTSCSTTQPSSESPYQQPNQLMAGEITRRVEQIPYQHRDELLQNLLWLAQTGEQTIPAVLEGLRHENPKVRSSCAWVLGRLADRRTIPNLQTAMKDSEATVRMECARTLVLMGDLAWSPALIEGLDSDRKEVRYLCHEALKTSTGHDFGYDHLNQNDNELKLSVLRWRQWWSEYSGDTFFAANYQQQHGLQPQAAAPSGESKMVEPPVGNAQPQSPEGASAPQGAGSAPIEPQIQMPPVEPQAKPLPNAEGNGASTPAPANRPNGG